MAGRLITTEAGAAIAAILTAVGAIWKSSRDMRTAREAQQPALVGSVLDSWKSLAEAAQSDAAVARATATEALRRQTESEGRLEVALHDLYRCQADLRAAELRLEAKMQVLEERVAQQEHSRDPRDPRSRSRSTDEHPEQ